MCNINNYKIHYLPVYSEKTNNTLV